MFTRHVEIDHVAAINALQKRGAIEKLLYLNSVWATPKLAQSSEYQKKFIGYYRMGRKKASFYSTYFSLLEEAAANTPLPTLKDILERLFHATGARHLSFGSKLLATVDDKIPIFDRNVAHMLGVKNGSLPEAGWVEKALERHAAIQAGLAAFTNHSRWPETERKFDAAFPEAKKLSAGRKADLLLWVSY